MKTSRTFPPGRTRPRTWSAVIARSLGETDRRCPLALEATQQVGAEVAARDLLDGTAQAHRVTLAHRDREVAARHRHGHSAVDEALPVRSGGDRAARSSRGEGVACAT